MMTKPGLTQAAMFDSEGFLISQRDWSVELGEQIATKLGLSLDAEMWNLINHIRESFFQERSMPTMTDILIKGDWTRKDIKSALGEQYCHVLGRIAGMSGPVGE